MYRFYEKKEAVREIQGFLVAIEPYEFKVSTNGIYDEDTRDAVKKIQGESGIEATGKVDADTLDIIYEDFIKVGKIKNIRNIFGQNVTFPFLPGESGEHIRILNRDLRVVLDHARISHYLRVSEYFSPYTEEAVRSVGELFGIENPRVDEEFYHRLLLELSAIKNAGQ